MNNQNDKGRKRPQTKRQKRDAVLTTMGQQTPDEQVLEFQRRYLANLMKKRGNGGSSVTQ